MSYSEAGGTIDTSGYVTAGGYVTKKYLFDAYPQLSDQAKSAGLWTWGYNLYGAVADGSYILTSRSSPVQTQAGGANWKTISLSYNGVSIKSDGTLWTWGYDSFGQLGDSGTTNQNSPVQTSSFGTNWKQASCSNSGQHTGAIKTDGTLWVWGNNNEGELGNGSTTQSTFPINSFSGTYKQISCGTYHTSAIKTDGTLWLTGFNLYGQLGDNTTVNKSSPVQTVAGGTNWKFVASSTHSAAIKTDGTLWLWGNGTSGQLGDNTTVKKSSPVQTISGGTNWKYVTCGDGVTAAIKTDGTLWSWGSNSYGQLGNNSRTSTSSPIQTISAGTNWKQVSTTGQYTGAIKTDGTLWLWGYNGYGRLADGTTANKSSPVQTIAGGTNWKQIACGSQSAAAIKDFNEDF